LNGIRLTIEMMPAFDNALLGAHRSLTARRMLPSPDLRQMVAALFVSGARYRYQRRQEFHILEKWWFTTMARFPRRLEPRS